MIKKIEFLGLLALLLLQALFALWNFNLLRAEWFLSQGKPLEAVATASFSYKLQFAAGTALLQAKKYEPAIVHLNAAIKLYPSYLDAWNNLAVAHIGQKHYATALNILEWQRRKFPMYKPAQDNYEQLKRMQKGSRKKRGKGTTNPTPSR
ncbi:MAG: tetratricopeptide repeat protein [Candidatus Sungbacteria bacterium]|nr:tetratricopeptide repeat protein [Candidatus Sungbacteria bacterium]